MNVSILLSDEFKRQFKRLAKKYKTLATDFVTFKNELMSNPLQGVDLGGGVRKVRMSITSKQKGKSGGARVITFNVAQSDNSEDIVITLMTIYDKSELSNVSDKYIKWLVSIISGTN